MAKLTRYIGPPGDDREYWLPRDRDALDAAWDRYYAEHPERDPSRDDLVQGPMTSDQDNAWRDVPF